MKKVLKWLDEKFEWTVMVIFLVLITSTLSLQIIFRYIFSSSMAWPEEFSRYCFVLTGLFAIPFCIKRETMLRVDIIVSMFGGRTKEVMFLISDIMAQCLWIYLFKYSFVVARASFRPVVYSTSMPWLPMCFLYCAPVFTLALTIFREFQSMYVRVKRIRDFGKEEAK